MSPPDAGLAPKIVAGLTGGIRKGRKEKKMAGGVAVRPVAASADCCETNTGSRAMQRREEGSRLGLIWSPSRTF